MYIRWVKYKMLYCICLECISMRCVCGKVLHFRQYRYSNFQSVKPILSNPLLLTEISITILLWGDQVPPKQMSMVMRSAEENTNRGV